MLATHWDQVLPVSLRERAPNCHISNLAILQRDAGLKVSEAGRRSAFFVLNGLQMSIEGPLTEWSGWTRSFVNMI